ncbi:MAG TPA: DNA polymerase IV [Candidatus Paceibacterota bacterium]
MYPRAILHMDGDSFFASVEQALDWRLRGKPVVTGAERGAATALSYEAKRKGARRGMTLQQIKAVCPDAIVVPSNYTAYSIYAHRMYKIVRQFTPEVEEYSIDECFADITGLTKKYSKTYEEIGEMIKAQLEQDLGITFGVGLAPNKTLAKIASSRNKPAGFTPLPKEKISEFLHDLPIGAVWGVGFSTTMQLERLEIRTALDFAEKDRAWLREKKISLPYQKIWAELNGGFARNLDEDGDERIGSILKTHTFKPTRDRECILSQLSANLEAACAKARRHKVKARLCRFYLKTQSFTYASLTLDLQVSLADPREFLRAIQARFDDVYEPGEMYRATGIGLYALTNDASVTPDLFGASSRVDREAPLIGAIDRMNHKYGRHTIFLGGSFGAILGGETSRKEPRLILPIHQRKKTISIPHLGIVH